MIPPPLWTAEEFERELKQAIAVFQNVRLEEPLERYLEEFDRYQGVFEDLLETTVDLVALHRNALQVLTNKKLLEAFRYLAGPPISKDDLKTVAEAPSLKASTLKGDPDLVRRIVDLVLSALDRRRFAWLQEEREPKEAERAAAVLASAALMATQRLSTARRHEGKRDQEQQVEDSLLGAGFKKVQTRKVYALPNAPAPGEFCGESYLNTRKADFLIRLWDHRVLALECKVSNSATNSVKRLNNEAAAKAEVWKRAFGETQVVCSAVISGVYKVHTLEEAQQRGLTIFWAHNLAVMLEWIAKTKAE